MLSPLWSLGPVVPSPRTRNSPTEKHTLKRSPLLARVLSPPPPRPLAPPLSQVGAPPLCRRASPGLLAPHPTPPAPPRPARSPRSSPGPLAPPAPPPASSSAARAAPTSESRHSSAARQQCGAARAGGDGAAPLSVPEGASRLRELSALMRALREARDDAEAAAGPSPDSHPAAAPAPAGPRPPRPAVEEILAGFAGLALRPPIALLPYGPAPTELKGRLVARLGSLSGRFELSARPAAPPRAPAGAARGLSLPGAPSASRRAPSRRAAACGGWSAARPPPPAARRRRRHRLTAAGGRGTRRACGGGHRRRRRPTTGWRRATACSARSSRGCLSATPGRGVPGASGTAGGAPTRRGRSGPPARTLARWTERPGAAGWPPWRRAAVGRALLRGGGRGVPERQRGASAALARRRRRRSRTRRVVRRRRRRPGVAHQAGCAAEVERLLQCISGRTVSSFNTMMKLDLFISTDLHVVAVPHEQRRRARWHESTRNPHSGSSGILAEGLVE